jgi:hypothetical protein
LNLYTRSSISQLHPHKSSQQHAQYKAKTLQHDNQREDEKLNWKSMLGKMKEGLLYAGQQLINLTPSAAEAVNCQFDKKTYIFWWAQKRS